MRNAHLRAAVAGLAALALAAYSAHGRVTPYDNYILLAQAFLRGEIAIQWPGPVIDALPLAGRYWIIEAPFPALLLLPWIALFHTANQTSLALLLCGVAIALCWLCCEHLDVPPSRAVWVCAFAFAGTQLWWGAMLGDVWFVAHVASVAATFLVLAELTGRRRGWLVGIGAVAAAFSRFSLVLAVPVYAWLLLRDRDPGERRVAALGFGALLALGTGAWVAYNLARWGVWYDIGYTAWYHQDSAGAPVGSPFQLRYLPYELWSFFVQGPLFEPTWPYVVPTLSGLAMTWTSPAFVLALFARRPRALTLGCWAAATLVAGPSFIYYVNGYAQFGMRHALDFAPFLIVLMALALRERMPALGPPLILWSCAVGSWGVWFWNAFYRGPNQ
jgi:hypothetical protein